MQHRVDARWSRIATLATMFAPLAFGACASSPTSAGDEAAAAALPLATAAAPNGAAPAAHASDAATPPLVGTEWHWLWTLDPERAWAPPDLARYTVTFGADGRLALRADCNRGFAGYRIDGLRLDVQPIGTTKMACGAGSLGDRFVKQLQGARYAVAVIGLLRVDLFADSGTMWFVAERDAKSARYVCDGGRSAVAVYTPDRARVLVGPDTLDLRATESASGARYADATTEWFTKGDEAVLVRDGVRVLAGCRVGERAT